MRNENSVPAQKKRPLYRYDFRIYKRMYCESERYARISRIGFFRYFRSRVKLRTRGFQKLLFRRQRNCPASDQSTRRIRHYLLVISILVPALWSAGLNFLQTALSINSRSRSRTVCHATDAPDPRIYQRKTTGSQFPKPSYTTRPLIVALNTPKPRQHTTMTKSVDVDSGDEPQEW